jgi:DNA-directed RNA polymerase specialized sigma24 family protein
VSAADSAKPGRSGQDLRPDAEEIYRRHGGWLVAFLRRFGHELAQDRAQETFVRTVGARTEIHNPRAFLARVATNTAHDRERRQAVRATRVAEHPLSAAAATGADQAEALVLKQAILGLREMLPGGPS